MPKAYESIKAGLLQAIAHRRGKQAKIVVHEMTKRRAKSTRTNAQIKT